MMLVLGALLSLLVGVSLGLLGGGGSILMVPILVYILRVPSAQAITMSLLVVGSTSAVAVVPHARAGHVQWKTGLLFGAAAMLGAFGGGRIAPHLPGRMLLIGFALLILVTATVLLRGGSAPAPPPSGPPRMAPALLFGVLVGCIAGLVGAGGGFLVVPTLVLFAKLPMHPAIATSLLIIALQSTAGLLGRIGHLSLDVTLAGATTVAAIVGSLFGSHLSTRLPQTRLRRAFAWFIIAIGLFMLMMEVRKGWDP